MVRVGKEAAQLRQWSSRQRLAALKRIIPKAKVTGALRRSGRGRRYCPRAPDAFMIWFLVALGLFCDDCYRQIYRWLVPWKKGDVPGRSTLCEARRRVGVAPLVRLAAEVVKLLAEPQTPGAFYRGMRLMALDGFVVDIPDMPANDAVFGRPGSGRAPAAFPQAHVLGLVEAGTHVFWRWLVKPCHTGEIPMTPPLLKHLQKDMLLLWDRNFLTAPHVRQVRERQAHLLARIKKNLIFRPIKRLRDGSYLAKLYRCAGDRQHDRDGILVRVIEYTFDDPNRPGVAEKHRLLSTLLDEREHPAKTLVELYHVRWEEELAIDELKTHEMERPVLRSQTPAGVVQEIYGLMLGHYVLRTLMHEAAKKVPISPLRISFVGTLKILRCRLPECPATPPARQRWWRNLLEEIAEETIPERRDRINPRVIKRKMSNWLKKRPVHYHCPQPTKQFHRSIVVLR
jgi:hypothetical protein